MRKMLYLIPQRPPVLEDDARALQIDYERNVRGEEYIWLHDGEEGVILDFSALPELIEALREICDTYTTPTQDVPSHPSNMTRR